MKLKNRYVMMSTKARAKVFCRVTTNKTSRICPRYTSRKCSFPPFKGVALKTTTLKI